MRKTTITCFLLSAVLVISACKEDTSSTVEPISFSDSSTPLKEVADFPVGVAIPYAQTINDANYITAVKRDFDIVTYENNMKYSTIVQNDGSLNFTQADAMLAKLNGLEIHGHTLGWHSQQNTDYLGKFIVAGSNFGPELLQNPGFEASNTVLTNWNIYNSGNPAGSASISVGTTARTGSNSLRVVNSTNYAGEQWRVQVASDAVALTIGKQYRVAYWVKPSVSGTIRLSTSPSAQYQADQNIAGTDWQLVTWTITANAAQTNIVLDMGQLTGTYFIDDISVTEVLPATGPPIINVTGIDNALKNYITGMVNHYKGRVKSWDVVNEVIADNAQLRNNGNTTPGAGVFVWSEYLGRNFGLKAFNYASAADPTADLYINDYGLESNPAKLDTLIAYVKEIRAKGAKVDGIGTQMHINSQVSYTGIISMFQKLAATGLKVKISELDIKMNFGNIDSYVFDKSQQLSQGDLYSFVISSYLKYIPKAQQGGITVWGLADNQSWLYNNGKDFPLLYNADYSKKLAYGGFIKGIKGQ
jgi:endo-1,4-beta-xylanase